MGNKITISALSILLSEQSDLTRNKCEKFLENFFLLIKESLQKGEEVRINDFGTFRLRKADDNEKEIEKGGDHRSLASRYKIIFTPSAQIKERINREFDIFPTVEVNDSLNPALLETYSEDTSYHIEEEQDAFSEDSENDIESGIIENQSLEEAEDDDFTREAYLTAEKMSSQTATDTEKTEVKPQDDEIEETEEDDVDDLNDPKEEEERPYAEERGGSDRFRTGVVWGFFIGLIACCLIGYFCYYFGYLEREDSGNSDSNELLAEDLQSDNSSEDVSTIPIEPATEVNEPVSEGDSEATPATVKYEENDETAAKVATEASDKKVYDTVSTTRYLTTIARDHYGNYNYWPIIYEENAAILDHPDRITPGTKVVVPPLSKYGIVPGDKRQIEEMKKKGREIYAPYRSQKTDKDGHRNAKKRKKER